MATTNELADNILNQMIKGIEGVFPKECNEKKRNELTERYRAMIYPFVTFIPRLNAAIGAVVCKCAIQYGVKKAINFAKAVRDGTFNGPNDPAHLMWLFLARNKGFKSLDVYKVAVSAARAFCEGRTLTALRPAGSDIFKWSPECELGLERIHNELQEYLKNDKAQVA